MWNKTAEGRELIEDFSKQIVADVAPEELDFFEELASGETSAPPASGDEELGFGLTTALEFVTPATISVVTAVFTFLGTELLKTVGKEATTSMVVYLKTYFFESSASLTAKQITEVEEIAQKAAKQHGLSEKITQKLTDSIVASLTKKT